MTPNRSHFDSIAAAYDGSLPAHVTEHYLRRRCGFLETQLAPGARVLDLGCGTGSLAHRLSSRGFRVAGCDPSAGMLGVAARRGLAVARAPAQVLPFAAGTFDGVYTVAVLHHVAAPEAVAAALTEMVRVLRPGGVAVVWDHNPLNPYWPLLMRRVPQDDGSERLVPLGEILAGLARGGATPTSARRLGFVPDFVPKRLLAAASGVERLLEALPLTRWVAAHNVVVARKH
jgi:SAM-dependent methyltransferase